MTTSTSKGKPGSKPLKTDKKARSMRSPEERKKMHDALKAMGKELGFKEVPLKGATILISEGTDII